MNLDEQIKAAEWLDGWFPGGAAPHILASLRELKRLREVSYAVTTLALQRQTYDDPDMRDAIDDLYAATLKGPHDGQ